MYLMKSYLFYYFCLLQRGMSLHIPNMFYPSASRRQFDVTFHKKLLIHNKIDCK